MNANKKQEITEHSFCNLDVDISTLLEEAYDYVIDDVTDDDVNDDDILVEKMIEHIRSSPHFTYVEVTNEFMSSVVHDAANELLPEKYQVDKIWSTDYEGFNADWSFNFSKKQTKKDLNIAAIIKESKIGRESYDYVHSEVCERLFSEFSKYIDISEAYREEEMLEDDETWITLCKNYISDKKKENKYE